MAWTLGGVKVFTQDLKEEVAQIIPRLQPLSGGTVLQTFGYDSDIHTVTGLVVGRSDKDDIKAMSQGGSVDLIDSTGYNEGSFLVKQVVVTRVNCICQTLRPDLDESSPVYNVEVQLYD